MSAKSVINNRKSYSCECLLSTDRKDRYVTTNGRRMKQEVSPSTAPVVSQNSTQSNRVDDLSLEIPEDGNIRAFTTDQMSTFFRLLNVDEHIIQRLHQKELDGVRFSKLKDSVLGDIGLKNPVIGYFRDRSKHKDTKTFWL